MAKRSCEKPPGLGLPEIGDIYSVNDCVNDNFADFTNYWKHNGYWFFDSPEAIGQVAQENSIDLQGHTLFYYEAHKLEFDGQSWQAFEPDSQLPVSVERPRHKALEGFDVIVVRPEHSAYPEHSPLSCSGLANRLKTNIHCLFETFEVAEAHLNQGAFSGCDPGNLRIVAVYSLNWPQWPLQSRL
jgi:hypothetical protein